jgi:hypothetical protein
MGRPGSGNQSITEEAQIIMFPWCRHAACSWTVTGTADSFSTGGAMRELDSQKKEADARYNERFLRFIRLFASIETNPKLFPKECRTCGRKFGSFSRYLRNTLAKGHGLEDCSEVMGGPFTMMYRHCACGNTLVLSLTPETMPMLDGFWGMLQEEAEETGRPFLTVVREFSDQCDHFIITQDFSSSEPD